MAISNITGIHGAVPPGEAYPDLVECLERLLDRAKTGELVGFAYATVATSGGVNNWTYGTGWEGAPADGLRYRLSATINMLNHRYTECLLDKGEEP